MAPFRRVPGEFWHLIGDGRAPPGNRRELNMKLRWEQAKGGNAGG